MQASRLRFSPALEKRAGGLSDVTGYRVASCLSNQRPSHRNQKWVDDITGAGEGLKRRPSPASPSRCRLPHFCLPWQRKIQAISDEQTFETQRNGGSGGGEGLPRMDADKRGLEKPKPIVWKPTPDMYRMDTKEGREAYEASLRSSGERRPAQSVLPPQPTQKRRGPGTPVVAPEENAETYAVLG